MPVLTIGIGYFGAETSTVKLNGLPPLANVGRWKLSENSTRDSFSHRCATQKYG